MALLLGICLARRKVDLPEAFLSPPKYLTHLIRKLPKSLKLWVLDTVIFPLEV